jgi:hypothetical protein
MTHDIAGNGPDLALVASVDHNPAKSSLKLISPHFSISTVVDPNGTLFEAKMRTPRSFKSHHDDANA